MTREEIKQTIQTLSPEKALVFLSEQLSGTANVSLRAWIEAEKGKIFWRLGNRADAICAYEASAALDPGGPGDLLLQHSRKIMDFYCKDFFNP